MGSVGVLVATSLLLMAVFASAACKGPPPPCSICTATNQYCLVHMGSPNWDPQIQCKPIPTEMTTGAVCTTCACIIAADFVAVAPPQCTGGGGALFTVTPNNDC